MAKSRRIVPILLTVCLLAAYASAATTVKFRQGGGSGYTDLTFDQTDINTGNDNLGRYDYFCTGASSPEYTLIGIKDLMTALPLNGPDDVLSATLTVYGYQGDNDYVTAYRVLTNWMPRPAGQNQNNVTGMHADLAGSQSWASGAFSASDYDAAGVTVQWGPASYKQPQVYDVTNIVKEMYRAGRSYGFVLSAAAGTGVYP